jgi:hypothetical protein
MTSAAIPERDVSDNPVYLAFAKKMACCAWRFAHFLFSLQTPQ